MYLFPNPFSDSFNSVLGVVIVGLNSLSLYKEILKYRIKICIRGDGGDS